MSNEATVLALFEEANPVPQEQITDETYIEPATYLATLQQRSSEVTKLDERTQGPTETNHRWRIVAAAAVLAILAGVAIVLLNQGTETEPPVVTNAPPTTVAEEAPTSTLDEAEEQWQAIPVWNDAGSGGTYRTNIYETPFAFTTPDGWFQAPGGSTETSFVIQLLEMSPLRIITMTTPMTVQDVVDEYVAAHAAIPEAEMSEPVSTDIGGANGMSFESIGLPFQVEDPSVVPFVGEDYLLDPGMGGPGGGSAVPILGAGKAMFHVVDIDGVTNLVVYQGIPDHYDENVAAAMEFLDSIVWNELR